MVLFNYSTRELTAKVVYYGPGLCGKTTNLQYVHGTLPDNVKGKMLSLATKTDRTLFFDFLPIDLGEIRGMKTRIQLYTVPGQVFYNETRKLVLKGADGIVFVADSQAAMLGANVESFRNLEDNLKAHGMKLSEMPHVIQFNKRDLPKLSTIEELNAAVNRYNVPFYESVATTGIGVQDTLKAITKLVLLHLTRKYDPKTAAAAESVAASAAAQPSAAPAQPVVAQTVRIRPEEMGVRAQVGRAIPLSKVSDPLAAVGRGRALEERIPDLPSIRPTAEPEFGDQEIDALVDEMRETVVPEEVAPVPIAAAKHRPEEEPEVYDLGEPDGSTFDPSGGSTDVVPPGPAPAGADSLFEIDHGVDPEWQPATPSWAEPAAAAEVPIEERADEDAWDIGEADAADGLAALRREPIEAPEPEARLTEALREGDLFEDPTVEVARMAAGESREIVVPVEIAVGAATRRFLLSMRLRLDPVE